MLTSLESLDDSDVDEEGVMVTKWKGDPPPGCRRVWREKVKNVESKKVLGNSSHMDEDPFFQIFFEMRLNICLKISFAHILLKQIIFERHDFRILFEANYFRKSTSTTGGGET